MRSLCFIAVCSLICVAMVGCQSDCSISSAEIGEKVVKQAVRTAIIQGPASALRK